MRGWVYVISNPAMPGLVKVGYSTKDPDSRAEELNHTGSPQPYIVEYEILIEEPRDIEQKTHKRLSPFSAGKEWFQCSVQEAAIAIRQASNGRAILENFKERTCDFDQFLFNQTALNKEPDEDSSLTLFWFQSLGRRLKPLVADKLPGASVEDKYLGLKMTVMAMENGDQRWKGIAIKDSTAAILMAIMKLAKLRGVQAQVPYKSAQSFSRFVLN